MVFMRTFLSFFQDFVGVGTKRGLESALVTLSLGVLFAGLIVKLIIDRFYIIF